MFTLPRSLILACAAVLTAQLVGCAAPVPASSGAAAEMTPAQFEQLRIEAEHALAANDPVAAGKRYVRMVTAYPNHAPTLFRLGTVYLRTGQFDAAQRAFKNSLRADPDMTKAQSNLALTHLHLFRHAALRALESPQVPDANKEALRALLVDVEHGLGPIAVAGGHK